MKDKKDIIGIGHNIINKAYIDNIIPMKMNSYSEKYEYNTLEIEKDVVKRVSDKLDNIIDCMEKCISVNKVFNIALACQMGLGKTYTMNNIIKYCKDKGIKVLYISGINLLGYQQLKDNLVKNTTGEVIDELKLQRHFIAGNREGVDFENLDADAIISNINNAIKSIKLLRDEGFKNIIIIDEAHMLRLDYSLKNSNLNESEVSQIMAMMDKLIREVQESNNKYNTLGLFWLSATFEVFAYDKSIEFTKMYQLESVVEEKIPVELYEPVVIPKFEDKQILWTLIELLRKNASGKGKQIVYLNNVEQIKRLIKKLIAYKKKTGEFENIDFVNGVTWICADKAEKNLVYNHIKEKGEIPEHIQLLFVTSIVTAGINIENKTSSTDLLICCTEDSFNLLNEIQIVGRFRDGIRLLTTLSTNASRKTAMNYKTFLEKNEHIQRNYINNMIKTLESNVLLNTSASKINELKTYRNKKIRNIFNCINVEDNRFVLSENAFYGMMYSRYQKEEILTSVKALANAFYHHFAYNIKLVSEVKIKDYSNEENYTIDKSIQLSNINKDEDDKTGVTKLLLVKDIKTSKSRELIEVIVGSKKIAEASNKTKLEYYTLENDDSKKFELMKQALDNSENDKLVIDVYFDLKTTNKKLQKLVDDKRLRHSLSLAKKDKDLKSQQETIEGFATSDANIKTAYHMEKLLNDIIRNRNKEVNKIKLNNEEFKYIYNSLLDLGALTSSYIEYVEEIDNIGVLRKRKKRFEEYSKKKEGNKNYSEKDLLIIKMKDIIQLVANIKKVKNPTEIRLSSMKKLD